SQRQVRAGTQAPVRNDIWVDQLADPVVGSRHRPKAQLTDQQAALRPHRRRLLSMVRANPKVERKNRKALPRLLRINQQPFTSGPGEPPGPFLRTTSSRAVAVGEAVGFTAEPTTSRPTAARQFALR